MIFFTTKEGNIFRSEVPESDSTPEPVPTSPAANHPDVDPLEVEVRYLFLTSDKLLGFPDTNKIPPTEKRKFGNRKLGTRIAPQKRKHFANAEELFFLATRME